MKKKHAVLGDTKCKRCKKMFFMPLASDWTYKKYRPSGNGLYYFCSWKCLRDYEKDHETKHEKKLKNIVEAELQGKRYND